LFVPIDPGLKMIKSSIPTDLFFNSSVAANPSVKPPAISSHTAVIFTPPGPYRLTQWSYVWDAGDPDLIIRDAPVLKPPAA